MGGQELPSQVFPISNEQLVKVFALEDKENLNPNLLVQCMHDVISNMEPIPVEILAKAPLKDKSIPKETRESHLRCFQILVSAFRFMYLAQQFLNSVVDDSYECLAMLRALGQRKAEMAVAGKSTKKFNGNLEILLDIYSLLMAPENLKNIW